jgi:hypothetical protein
VAFTQELVGGNCVVVVGPAVVVAVCVVVVDGAIAIESVDGNVSAVGSDGELLVVSTVAAGSGVPDAPHPAARRDSVVTSARRRMAAFDMARHPTARLSKLNLRT